MALPVGIWPSVFLWFAVARKYNGEVAQGAISNVPP
jgi:hypothetical protein